MLLQKKGGNLSDLQAGIRPGYPVLLPDADAARPIGKNSIPKARRPARKFTGTTPTKIIIKKAIKDLFFEYMLAPPISLSIIMVDIK
jgi:hypothetical protein